MEGTDKTSMVTTAINNMHKGASNKIDNIKRVIETFYTEIKVSDPKLADKINRLQDTIIAYREDKDNITEALYKLAAETASIPMNHVVVEGLKVLNITCVKDFIKKLPADINSIDPVELIKLLQEVFVLDAIIARGEGVIEDAIFDEVDKQCDVGVTKFDKLIKRLKKSSEGMDSMLAAAEGDHSKEAAAAAEGDHSKETAAASGGGGAKKRKYTKRKKRKTAKRKKKKTAKRKKRKRRKATRAKK
tara:strand:+ start:2278 stop:3015 length:738 start_codon:yes stop_codon:yes gene_type:complete